jgi:hypothetical protein
MPTPSCCAGLRSESKLTGETEVFSQLKQAWAEFAERGSNRRSSYRASCSRCSATSGCALAFPVEYRQRFLRIAGTRLLDQPGERGPVLLVSAGNWPNRSLVAGTELWIWNRNHERATALAKLASQP